MNNAAAPSALTRRFGAEARADGTAKFMLWAPSVRSVTLEVDGHEMDMAALPDGLAVPDPASRQQADDVHGASVLTSPEYDWQHTEWRNRPWHEAVIVEIHPGVAGGFDGVRAQLPALAELGVTAIELMPVADFPGRRNWGYDGVLPYAPDTAYGTPAQLKALVDAAHGLGLMVLLDVVYNHFGPDGAYLHAYAKPFFDPDVHTPWGAAIDFTRPEVQRFFIDNALMWLNEYRFDGLRFDAVHAISPQDFLPVLAAELRAVAIRPAHLVLEHEGNRASLLRSGPHSPGFDAQWSDDWHHCMHVLLTGENEGYYAGFQNPAAQLARALSDGFVYQGEQTPHHGARGEPSAHLPSEAFVICLQNHDQIGNRALGERLSVLAQPAALRAATTSLLLCPFIPLLFFGEEQGSARPFLFFTDHNLDLAKLVREGRRREFAQFAAFHDPGQREAIPDPNDEATFLACRMLPQDTKSETACATRMLHRHLLALRRQHVTPGIAGCRSLGAAVFGPKAVRAAWRLGNGRVLEIATNLAPDAVDYAAPGVALFSNEVLEAGRLPGYCTAAFVKDAA